MIPVAETESGQAENLRTGLDDVAALNALFEAVPYGMLLLETNGRIAQVNAHLARMFGYTPGELIGEPVEILIPHRLKPHHVALRTGYAAAPTPRPMGKGRDLTGRRKDGVEVPVEIALSAIQTPRGRLPFASVVDITERKRAELRLREANAQLEEFTSVASHDLRSPIRGVANLIEFILDDHGREVPEPVLRNLGRMRDRVQRMEKLIDDLLTYARAGRRTMGLEPVVLSEVMDEILRLEPTPSGFSITLDIALPPFLGARTPLATVLRNLVSNAIRHHDRTEGHIAVRARNEGVHCAIEVSDDGPGIPEAARARVFRLFQTLSADTDRGSGLGLAVAQRLVEGHGGNLCLLSGAGRGSIFRILWPLYMRSDLDD